MKTFFTFISLFLILSCHAENRIKIAVIDTGITAKMSVKPFMCKSGVLDFSNTTPYDTHGHGTNIVDIIAKNVNPNTHCIISLKFYDLSSLKENNIKSGIKALRYVLQDRDIKYLNLSMGGPKKEKYEEYLIKKILDRGVITTIAAGNEGNNLNSKKGKFYPASYRDNFKHNNLYVVKSDLPSSNYGNIVTDTYKGCHNKPNFKDVGVIPLCGTSQSSAKKMADILKSVVLYKAGDLNDRQKSN